MLLMALMMASVRSLVILGPGPPTAPRSFKLHDEQPHDMRRRIQCRRDYAVLANSSVVYLRGGQGYGRWDPFLGACVTLLTIIGKGVLAECQVVTKPDLDSSMLVAFHLINNVSQQIGSLDACLNGVETHLTGRLTGLEDRLGGVETHLTGRLTGLEDRLGGVETHLTGRLTGVEDRLGGLEDRFVGLEDRFVGLEDRFGGLEDRFGGFEVQIGAVLAHLGIVTDSKGRPTSFQGRPTGGSAGDSAGGAAGDSAGGAAGDSAGGQAGDSAGGQAGGRAAGRAGDSAAVPAAVRVAYGACKTAYKVAAFAALAAGCIKVSPLEVRHHKRIVKVG